MRIIITEEQSKKLFIPRNIDKRYSDWNKAQSSITINGQTIKLNQYNLDGNEVGLWLNDPSTINVNYNKTKEFLSDIFSNLTIEGDFFKFNGINYLKQDLNNGYLYVSYSKIWFILMDRYSLSRGQVQDLMRVWMEEAYKLGSLTPKDIS